MPEGTSCRLDASDVAEDYGWQPAFKASEAVDIYTKNGVKIEVTHSDRDLIVNVVRRGLGDEVEVMSKPSTEHLLYWLSDGRIGAGPRGHWVQIREGKGHPSSRRDWTIDEVVDFGADLVDRAFVTRIFDLFEANLARPRLGPHYPTYFGAWPNGAIFLHLFGLDCAPFALGFNPKSRELQISGTWTAYKARGKKGHPGYDGLAAILGLSSDGPQTMVPVAGLDPDEVWRIAESVALAINFR